ncbi:MAG: hypothetical protein AXA67_02290 [Methylothermaceae bacteria B42]|nr:MAG: hypothetical protein AXA67_02290 [Methylothermaceae bacteria B42]HHJ39316.1 hypothetical protein [Methylothermaceae bacterium]
MKYLPILLLIAGLSVISTAGARGWHRDGYDLEAYIHHRLESQHLRIEEGLDCGRLTPRQARKLFRKHVKIVRLESHFASDGWLSPHEIKVLERKINRLDHKIIAKMHRTRPYVPSRFNRWQGYYSQPRVYDNGRWNRQLPGTDFYFGGLRGRIMFGP